MRHISRNNILNIDVGVVSRYSSTCRNHPLRLNCGTMKHEIWKDIPGYEGYYQVSNNGRVKSLDRDYVDSIGRSYSVLGKIKSTHKMNNDYFGVGLQNPLTKKSKTHLVHQLVAMAFLNHKPDGNNIVVDHIDNDKSNNTLGNLRLVTNRYNVSRSKKGNSIYTGVYLDRGRYWTAQIGFKGVVKKLGTFNTELDAARAYRLELLKIMINQGLATWLNLEDNGIEVN